MSSEFGPVYRSRPASFQHPPRDGYLRCPLPFVILDWASWTWIPVVKFVKRPEDSGSGLAMPGSHHGGISASLVYPHDGSKRPSSHQKTVRENGRPAAEHRLEIENSTLLNSLSAEEIKARSLATTREAALWVSVSIVFPVQAAFDTY